MHDVDICNPKSADGNLLEIDDAARAELAQPGAQQVGLALVQLDGIVLDERVDDAGELALVVGEHLPRVVLGVDDGRAVPHPGIVPPTATSSPRITPDYDRRVPISCNACSCVPPLCTECFAELLARWGPTADAFGTRWGAGLRVTLDLRGEAPRSWPAWESDAAANVRRICTRIVMPLAHSLPERRDPALVDTFARRCGAAASAAYSTMTLAEARRHVADFDRRLPSWRADVATRIKAG
jgi:hypothetical protein